jgi:hypothetical protein
MQSISGPQGQPELGHLLIVVNQQHAADQYRMVLRPAFDREPARILN